MFAKALFFNLGASELIVLTACGLFLLAPAGIVLLIVLFSRKKPSDYDREDRDWVWFKKVGEKSGADC